MNNDKIERLDLRRANSSDDLINKCSKLRKKREEYRKQLEEETLNIIHV